jgi:NADH:ubiquinone oxidoreductase subunit 4 (subunit M)
MVKSFIFFYIFFELRLLPVVVLVLIFGKNPERVQARFYILIYTLVGAVPLLINILMLPEYSFFVNIPLSKVLYVKYCLTNIVVFF